MLQGTIPIGRKKKEDFFSYSAYTDSRMAEDCLASVIASNCLATQWLWPHQHKEIMLLTEKAKLAKRLAIGQIVPDIKKKCPFLMEGLLYMLRRMSIVVPH